MKHPYIPFIANQCKELYGIALKAIQKENVKQILDKEWISIVRRRFIESNVFKLNFSIY